MIDRTAGHKLIETGTLVEFEVKNRRVEPSPDGETSFVHIDIQLGGPGVAARLWVERLKGKKTLALVQ